jgi:hypothetical protein
MDVLSELRQKKSRGGERFSITLTVLHIVPTRGRTDNKPERQRGRQCNTLVVLLNGLRAAWLTGSLLVAMQSGRGEKFRKDFLHRSRYYITAPADHNAEGTRPQSPCGQRKGGAVENSKYRRAWAVVKVFTEAPGFGPGQFVFLGNDNYRPDESQIDFERRVCERFDIDKRHRLRYVEIDM